MRHANLRRAAAAPVIAAKPDSALLYDTGVRYTDDLVWVCGRVGVYCGGMTMRWVLAHVFD